MNLKDPRVQKIMLGVMTLLIVSYVYFGTNFLPFSYPVRSAKISALEKEDAKISAELEKARKMVGNLARLEAEYQRLHEQWILAQELLPEQKEMPDLLRKVTSAGMKAGVEFALFEPAPVVPHDFYADHPVKVKVRGGYHQVGIFLSRLANLPRIVNVNKLELTQPTGKSGGGKNARSAGSANRLGTVEAEFTLSAYTLMGGVDNGSVHAQTASTK